MDRGCSRDPDEASAEAEDGSAGCAVDSEAAVRGPVSSHLASECRKSRPTAAALASASYGPGSNAHHESAAGGCSERRSALQKEIVAGTRTAATRIHPFITLGKPASIRPAAVNRSAEPNHHGVNTSDRTRGRELCGCTAFDDPSRSGCINRVGVRADYR